jgi:glutamine amidotransferase-like uncharacterized protein
MKLLRRIPSLRLRIVIIAVALLICPETAPATTTTLSKTDGVTTPPKIRVALLNDVNCTDERSREGIWYVIKTADDFAAVKVSTATLSSPDLAKNFDVVILPGGTGGGQGRALGVAGCRNVSQFVENGGALIAICAGGYLIGQGWNAETSSIVLLNLDTHDDKNWARGEQYIDVEKLPSDAKLQPTKHIMWFQNGPLFKHEELGRADYTPLVRYVTDLAKPGAPKGQMIGRDAVIAGPYGTGRVVGFGPHPELSPSVRHWLANSIRWAAKRRGNATPPPPITPDLVLEGKERAGQISVN